MQCVFETQTFQLSLFDLRRVTLLLVGFLEEIVKHVEYKHNIGHINNNQ